MKKSVIICAALLLVLSLFSGCAFIKKSTSVSPPADSGQPVTSETPSPSAAGAETADKLTGIVTIESVKSEYKSDYIDTAIEIPKLTGLKDSAVQDSINAVFSDVMAAAQQDIKPWEAESREYASDDQDNINPYQIYLSYTVPYNLNGILSINLSDYRYRGAAHGGDTRSSYTFDLTTGRQLSLGDLMTDGSGCRDRINAAIQTKIDGQIKNNTLSEIAPFSDIGDHPSFYLTPDSLVFYFQEYEYFTYADGIQEYPIPYSDVSDLLKPEYASLTIKTIILDPYAANKLAIGDIGQAALTGNPSTGYMWQYTIDDSSIVEYSRDQYQSDAQAGEVGAGGTFTWDFRALKAGTASITFKYYRAWDDSSDSAPEDTIVYTVIIGK
jgi:predicted secreted protein